MEKSSWTDRVLNAVSYGVKEGRDILLTIKRGTANWTGHMVCRDCLLKDVIDGKIEGRI